MSIDVRCHYGTARSSKNNSHHQSKNVCRRTLLQRYSRQPFTIANSLFIEEEYDEALSLYTQAIQQNSKNFEFFEKRATCFIKLAKFEEAIKDADQAIQLSPDNIYSYLRKG
jgi:tetratricopeptide (TPR) repeat protein